MYIYFTHSRHVQVFIELVLKSEQEEYAHEGIDWVNIDYFNNAAICELIDKPRVVRLLIVLNIMMVQLTFLSFCICIGYHCGS